MKKLVILMLVSMVPFLTMAQKRTKKDKEIKTETTDKSSSVTSNFMIIKGVEVDMTQEGMDQEEKEIVGYRTFTNVFNVTGRVARSETSRTVQ